MIYKYNRLVRKNVPKALREEQGVYARTRRKISDKEYEEKIDEAINIGVKRVMEAKTNQTLAWEIADLFELMLTKANIHNISYDQIEKIRSSITEKLGGYDSKTLLAYTYEDEDIKNIKTGCKTCALRNKCDLPDNLSEDNDPDKGKLCISYVPELYEQKGVKHK